MTPTSASVDAADGHADAVRQHVAFDLDHAADSARRPARALRALDAAARRRELERTDRRHAQHRQSSGVGFAATARPRVHLSAPAVRSARSPARPDRPESALESTNRRDARRGGRAPTRRRRGRRSLRRAASAADAAAGRRPNALEFIGGLGHSTAVPTQRHRRAVSARSVAIVRAPSRCRRLSGTTHVRRSRRRAARRSSGRFSDLGVARGAPVVSAVGNRPIFFAVVAACMEAGAALVPLGEATDAEAVALIEQAGAVARDHRSRSAAPRRVASVARARACGSSGSPIAAIAPPIRTVGRPEAHVGIDESAEGGDRVGDASRQRRPPRHRRDGHRAGRRQLHLHSAVPLVRDRQRRHAAALAGHARSRSGSRSIRRSSCAMSRRAAPRCFRACRSCSSASSRSNTIDRLPASLRLLITAGARIDAGTVSWFRRTLDRKVHSFYGSSETGGIAYDDSEARERSAARRTRHAGNDDRRSVRPSAGRSPAESSSQGNAVASGYAHGTERSTSRRSPTADSSPATSAIWTTLAGSS